MSDDEAKTALEASESWKGRIAIVGYDPAAGEGATFPADQQKYCYVTDVNTCEDDRCRCHMDSPYTPTIRPEEIRQSFEFTNVSKGGKTYTVTITASCVVWDYPGTCRPKVVKFARLFEASPEHFVSLDGSEQRRETA